METAEKTRERHGEQHLVTVTVNNKPVQLHYHRVTGLEIKEAAIEQGVEIELDFILVEEGHHGEESHVIGDDDEITVNEHSVFTANDGDDNS
jgi:hypothetical protein